MADAIPAAVGTTPAPADAIPAAAGTTPAPAGAIPAAAGAAPKKDRTLILIGLAALVVIVILVSYVMAQPKPIVLKVLKGAHDVYVDAPPHFNWFFSGPVLSEHLNAYPGQIQAMNVCRSDPKCNGVATVGNGFILMKDEAGAPKTLIPDYFNLFAGRPGPTTQKLIGSSAKPVTRAWER